MHWTDKFIINPKLGKLNCAEFVSYIGKEEFDLNLIFPQTKSLGNPEVMSFEIKSNLNRYISEQTEYPCDGDLVVMNGKSSLAHVGMVAIINNELYVIHTFFKIKSILRTKIKDLIFLGLTLEGYYKWQK